MSEFCGMLSDIGILFVSRTLTIRSLFNSILQPWSSLMADFVEINWENCLGSRYSIWGDQTRGTTAADVLVMKRFRKLILFLLIHNSNSYSILKMLGFNFSFWLKQLFVLFLDGRSVEILRLSSLWSWCAVVARYYTWGSILVLSSWDESKRLCTWDMKGKVARFVLPNSQHP